MGIETVGTPALWSGFIVFVLAMLAVDLGVFNRKAHVVSTKEALLWSAIWVFFAVAFNIGVYLWFGSEKALEFATGYIIEKSLAVDNIFVFVVIFATFGIPAQYQHRVLFWGVVGALVMRAAMIFAGVALLERFHWTIYLFGALLVLTGVKLLLQRNQEHHPERNPLVRAFQRMFPITHHLDGQRFFTFRDGKRFGTPLLLALVAIEVSDLIFAIDSIPAIFAITRDPFIVFTSNIFAILGLRSMYFLLAGAIERFGYLKIGLSVVLIFVGVKMMLIDVMKIPIGLSLGIVAAILGGSMVLSILRPAAKESAAGAPLASDGGDREDPPHAVG